MPLRNSDAMGTCDRLNELNQLPRDRQVMPEVMTPSTAPTEQLKIVIVGHVDHGKSTFVGRLFHDTGSLPEGKLEQLQQVAQRRGVPFEWANLKDPLQSERDQNITIDTAQIWFQTSKRQYVIIDAPGHKEFLKNMITGAANAEAALLIDAHEGVQENSRRHGYLLNLLGIRQIAVLVNKMDLENYDQAKFHQIESEYRVWLKTIGVQPATFIPIAAKHGDNIASRSVQMPWWRGPSVLETLDEFKVSGLPKDQPLRLPIQDIYRFDERRILAGRLEAGSIKVGDKLIFSPSNKTSTVRSIERWSAPPCESASAGESIGITLTEQIFVARGAVATLENALPYELSRFKAKLFWLGKQPFAKGKSYKLKLATQEVECRIESIERVIDASTLETVSRKENEMFVGRHEVAELTLHTRRPIAFDARGDSAPGPLCHCGWFRGVRRRHHRGRQLPAPHARRAYQEREHLLEPGQGHLAPTRIAQRPSGLRAVADRAVRRQQVHHRHRVGARTVQFGPPRLCARRCQHPARPRLRSWLLA